MNKIKQTFKGINIDIAITGTLLLVLVLLIKSLWAFDAPPTPLDFFLKIQVDETLPTPDSYILEMQVINPNAEPYPEDTEESLNLPNKAYGEVGYYQFPIIRRLNPLKELPVLLISVPHQHLVRFRVKAQNEKGQGPWTPWQQWKEVPQLLPSPPLEAE